MGGQHEVGRLACRVDVAGRTEHGAYIGERGDGQAVPRGHHLVVAGRLRTGQAGLEHPLPGALPPRSVVWVALQAQGGAAVLEGPLGRHTEQLGGPGALGRAQHLGELGWRPHVGKAFHAFGVRIERRGKGALGCAEVPEQEVARFTCNALAEGVAGQPPPVGVDPGQLGVVVQHLLEVRNHPGRVHGIPGEATAQLVVHPASGHRLTGGVGHGQGHRRAGAGVVAQQELQDHRRRKLGRAPEAAVVCVEPRTQRLDGILQH